MRSLALLASVAWLTGCNAARYQMPAEADGAMRGLVACIKREAAALDDGRSDILSIAVAVNSACAAEKRIVLDTMSQGQGFDFRRQLERRMEASNWKLAAEAVAIHGRKRPEPDDG